MSCSRGQNQIICQLQVIDYQQVAKLGIILSDVETASVSLIVTNPGPHSSVVLDAEVN